MSAVARRYYERGQGALGRGDCRGAEEAMRAALDLAPYYAAARLGQAVALAKLGDAPRAAAVLRAGLGRATSPKVAGAMWCLLGDVLVLAGDFLGAEEAFRAAAQLPGVDARVQSGLARVYARLGRFADMAAALRAAATS